MFTITNHKNYLELKVSGTISREDYAKLEAAFNEALKENDKIKMLVDLCGFEKYDLRAVWDDMVFGAKHIKHFSDCAIVGNKKWERWAAQLSDFFMNNEILFFEEDDVAKAHKWLNS